MLTYLIIVSNQFKAQVNPTPKMNLLPLVIRTQSEEI